MRQHCITFRLMKLIRFFSQIIVVSTLVLSANQVVAADALPKLDLKPAYPNLKFTLPVALEESPDGTHRLFLVEQDGRIWILPSDRNSAEPKLFLDISDRHPHGQLEEGLLSIAFHPQ